MVIIQQFPSGPLFTNAYVVACPQTKHSLLIDPAPQSAASILAYLSAHAFNCKKIILTHSHWDHIADLSIVKKALQVPIAIHPLDLPNLENPGADLLPCPLIFPPMHAEELLQDNDIVQCGTLQLQVIHTPGHSPGSLCLYEKEKTFLISGDTLFQGSMGRVDFPTSEKEKMWQSLKQLSLLPSQTVVYPGHGSLTTIEEEKHWLSHAKDIFDR